MTATLPLGHVGECKTEEEFYTALSVIFNDSRLNIVLEELRSIGNTVEEWKKE